MKKRELLKITSLLATPRMMTAAENDTLHNTDSYSWSKVYRYGHYLRAAASNNILYIAIYLPEYMRAGSKHPAYELYIDCTRKKFVTYNRIDKKWFDAMLDKIAWPSNVLNAEEEWISTKDDTLIKSCLGTKSGGYRGILAYQRGIRQDELAARHKRETDPWDADLKQIRPVPQDWNHWAQKEGIPHNFIFYQYEKGGAKTGYCTYCERDIPIQKHLHNDMGQCPRCHRKVQYKAVGRAGSFATPYVFMYLIQKCKDGFVVRQFSGNCWYAPGAYENPKFCCHETRRAIYSPSAWNLRTYAWGDYKQVTYRWNYSFLCHPRTTCIQAGRVYGRTLPDLAKTYLRGTDLVEQIKRSPDDIDPEVFLAKYCYAEKAKMLKKAKLSVLEKDYSSNSEMYNNIEITQIGNLAKMLGIDQYRLKRLRANKGGWDFLKWLRFEKSINKLIPDYVISWFCAQYIHHDRLDFIADRMSYLQIYNYIRRQMSDCKMSCREVLTTWRDYLSMASRCNLDVKDEIIYRVKLLRQRHDELVLLQEAQRAEEQAKTLEEKFPLVNEICMSLKEKYEYCGETYTVLAPSGILDILLEGRALHHCVANSDTYCERIERHESYILFLRLASMPTTSYYTLEVEPGGTVRQKRTAYDRQKEDIKEAEGFLREWQAVVSTRLSENDKQKAEESKILRFKLFDELQTKNVTINTGDLAGHRLADVLMADLMEAA